MKLSDFVGNESLARLLARAGLPQTSLFTGPSGVGKKGFAVTLAALANCRQPLGEDPCGLCPSCLKIESGNHPDVVVADASWVESFLKARKKNFNPRVIPIDVAREIAHEAQYRPFEGKLRVFVIDEAEKLNEPAANALLKTLEEPPDTTRLVLISASPNRLLPTILSRCQIFKFRPLSRGEIRRYLERSMESGRAGLLAAFADGSIGSALSLDLEGALRDRDAMLELLGDWIQHGSFARIYFAAEADPLRGDLKSRERTLALLDHLHVLAQDLYFVLAGTPERLINADREAELSSLASQVSLEWVEVFLYHVREAKRDIEHYLNPLLCFETFWLRSRITHGVGAYGQV